MGEKRGEKMKRESVREEEKRGYREEEEEGG